MAESNGNQPFYGKQRVLPVQTMPAEFKANRGDLQLLDKCLPAGNGTDRKPIDPRKIMIIAKSGQTGNLQNADFN